MKKSISFLLIGLVCALSAAAQLSPGTWQLYPNFCGFYYNDNTSPYDALYSRVIDTPDNMVYILSGYNLHSYDKQNSELYSYTSQNKLSDYRIVNYYYNYDSKYLVLCYANCNIDLLYDDGRVVNLPEIKQFNTNITKSINDVQFLGDKMYVATTFGIVVYDNSKYQVVESGIYNIDISAAFPVNDKLYILYKATGSNNKELYVAALEGRHNSLDSFTKVDNSVANLQSFLKIGDYTYLAMTNKRVVYTLSINSESNTRTMTNTGQTNLSNFFTRSAIGGTFVNNNGQYVVFNSLGQKESVTDLPDNFKKASATGWNGLSSLWFSIKYSISNYDLSGDVPTVKISDFAPKGFNCVAPAYMFPSNIPGAFYVSNLGYSNYCTAGITTGHGDWIAQTTDFVNGDNIVDVSCREATLDFWYGTTYQGYCDDKRLYGGPTGFAEYPEDPSITFTASQFEGIYKVKDNKQIGLYDWTNSPFTTQGGWNSRVFDVQFDPEGNLWVGFWCNFGSDNFGPYAILPAEKVKLDPAEITADDWILSTWSNPDDTSVSRGGPEMKSIFHKSGLYMVSIDDIYLSGARFYKHNGTYTNTADDSAVSYSSFTDQDGNAFSATRSTCVAQDVNGHCWIGTTSGIIEVDDPAAAFEPNFTVRRPKVARNDGTEYADYLLSSELIHSIAVDPSNRKWIATDASGVYLVSADGSEIIDHFDMNNSPLTTNTVYSIYCDPTSNKVWFGSKEGIFCYSSTSAPGKEDYSEVYAYPNPVRPDYTGWITVTGLMDNSYVKIADAAGNVFFNGRAEGGMVTWDGCNASGDRVKSGVYFVFASENASGGSSAAVTKIMVIR